MTTFKDIVFTIGGSVLISISWLLLVCQLFICIRSLRINKNILFNCASLLHLIHLFTAVFYLLDAIRKVRYNLMPSNPYAGFWICTLPWFLIALWELISAALIAFFGISLQNYTKSHLSRTSVKEAVDLLPQGICVIDSNERILLANLKAQDISRQLTGGPLTSAAAFRQAVFTRSKDLKEFDFSASTKNVIDPDGLLPENDSRKIISLDDGRVFLATSRELSLPDGNYKQIVLSDVTRNVDIITELSEKNKKLLEVQKRIKAYQVRASEMFLEQEVLAARIAVHDGLGSLLLHCKYYLEHPENVDEEQLLQMLVQTNALLLQDTTGTDSSPDIYIKALEAAQNMGICVTVNGDVPSKSQGFESPFQTSDKRYDACSILAMAIRECCANAKKHAGSKQLFVDIARNDHGITITITNDGLPPANEKIIETGGLKSLRRVVEDSGASMHIECSPAFRLIISINDQPL